MMLPRLFPFLCLFHLARATTNSTTADCPSPDTTSCNYRSVWSVLASCGFTLLICVWHAIHPSVPLPGYRRIHVILYRLCLMLVAFLTPEIMITAAFDEWDEARKILKRARGRPHNLKWWTMTHSHFVLIGGFALRDDTGIEEIKIDRFLSLVREGNIINPVITRREIKDKSTSDSWGKVVLIVQLSWFATQFVARLVDHLAVTLVELDTVCMALLTVPLIFLWWQKPRCPRYPHIFYARAFVINPEGQEISQEGDDLETLLVSSTIRRNRNWLDLLIPAESHPSYLIPLLLTWSIFGALHAIAWNYEFPTEIERTAWRVASLTLAGTPVIFGVLAAVAHSDIERFVPLVVGKFMLVYFLPIAGVISRLLLVSLMFASLRSLPSSAYQKIPWTDYIPHL